MLGFLGSRLNLGFATQMPLLLRASRSQYRPEPEDQRGYILTLELIVRRSLKDMFMLAWGAKSKQGYSKAGT